MADIRASPPWGTSEEPPLGRHARDGREKVNAPVLSSAPASMSYPMVVADGLEKARVGAA